MTEEELIQPENTVARLKLIYYTKGEWKLNRWVWELPSPEERLVRPGDRIWPAGENEKSLFTVKAIKQPGEKFYPEGGVVCSTNGGADRTFFMDAVIKHPSTKKKKKGE